MSNTLQVIFYSMQMEKEIKKHFLLGQRVKYKKMIRINIWGSVHF